MSLQDESEILENQMKSKEDWELKDFEYFIVTSDAVIAVFYEGEKEVRGFVLSSKLGQQNKRDVTFDKDKVVKSLHRDGISVIDELSNWWETGQSVNRDIDDYLNQ